MSDPDRDPNNSRMNKQPKHRFRRRRRNRHASPNAYIGSTSDNQITLQQLNSSETFPQEVIAILPTEIPPPVLLSQISSKAFDTETINAMSSHNIPVRLLQTSGGGSVDHNLNSSSREADFQTRPMYDLFEDPTVAHEEGVLALVGQPLDKPTLYSATPTMTEETIELNRRKVTINIRRKKMIVWLLIHAFILTWTGLSDIFQKLYKENENVFSMTILKPWLMPALIIEMALTGLTLLTVIVKMTVLKDKCVGSFYRFVTGVNNIQYLVMLLALPFGMYFFFNELSTNMRSELEKDIKSIDRIGISWNATQVERSCCGIDSRRDWNNATASAAKAIEELNTKEGFLTRASGDTKYPISCCNSTALKQDELCSELTGNYWKIGCHDKESSVLLDYLIVLMGLILASFFLAIVIKLRVSKLERYLSIFRPSEMS